MKVSPYKEDAIALLLMLFNLLSVVIAIGSIYLLPFIIALSVSIILYGSLFYAETKYKRQTPVVFLVLLIHIFLFIACFLLKNEGWMPYSGTIFYFSLASMSLILLMAGKPFTLYNSAGKGFLPLHYVTSWMWTILYCLAGITSLAFMPNVAFIYVPFLVVVTGISLTVLFNFFYFGSSNKRKRVFNVGQYCVKEVHFSNEIEEFYALTSTEIWNAISQFSQKTVKTKQELKEIIVKSDSIYTGQIRFLAYHHEQPIGTIFCVEDNPRGLPIERDTGISMNELRKTGKIIEVGHFTINIANRFKQDIFLALFKAIIDFALSKQITFLLNCSLSHASTMYEKIGFTKISPPMPDKILGVNVCPSALNLARLVVLHETSPSGTVQKLKPILNPYIAERYYKRELILNLFKKMKSYDLQVGDLLRSPLLLDTPMYDRRGMA